MTRKVRSVEGATPRWAGCLLATLLFTVAWHVDPAAGQGLSLTEAIDRGLSRSPLLDVAERDRDRAAAGVDRARAAFLPRLEASYGYARGDQPVYVFGSKLNQGRFTSDDFDVGRLNEPDPIDNFRSALTLHQPVYTGGRARLGLERAHTARRMAGLRSTRVSQEVIFQVARAYFGLRLAQERRDRVDLAVRAAEANLSLAGSRFRAGLAVESDVLAAEVRLARLREDAITAGSEVTVAEAALNDAMGVPVEQPVEASDPLRLRAEPEAGPMEEILARRADYQALLLEAETREHEVRLARAAFLPTVGLEGAYEVNTAGPFSDGQGSWSVMAVLRWNLFNGGADRARTREAEAARDQARAVSARAKSRIGLEIREARAQITAARERTRVADRAIAQAEETLRIIRIRYEAGLATIVDLLNAEVALTESRTRLTEALFRQNVAVAAWELALGRLDRSSLQ